MKKVSLVILSIILLTRCVDSNKTGDKSITKQEDKDSVKTNLWGAIDIKSWDKTPSINDRVATEDDVKRGLAVYTVEDGGSEHRPYKIHLPQLAYLVDSETKKEELVVVIQIEITSQNILAGFRNLEGGNGACLLYELKFLDKQKIKQLTAN